MEPIFCSLQKPLKKKVQKFLEGKISIGSIEAEINHLSTCSSCLNILIRLREKLNYKHNEEIFDRYLELRRKLTVKDGKLDEKILETLWDARIDFQTFQLEKKRIHKQLLERI